MWSQRFDGSRRSAQKPRFIMLRLATLLAVLLPCLAFADDAPEKKEEKKDAAEKPKEEKPKKAAAKKTPVGKKAKE